MFCNEKNICWPVEGLSLHRRVGAGRVSGGGKSGKVDGTGKSEGSQGAQGSGQSQGAGGAGQSQGGVGAERGGEAGKTEESGKEGSAAGDAESVSDAGSNESGRSAGSESTSDNDFPQAPPRQTPIDIRTRGYIRERSPGSNLIHVRKDGVSGVIDMLEVDAVEDSLGVFLAKNKQDETSDKLPLRSIAVDVWKQFSGKSVGDLKSINYQKVVNDEMKNKINEALGMVGLGPKSTVTVRPDGTAQETQAFAHLMDSTFGIGASKLLSENAELSSRRITNIDLYPDSDVDIQFNF